MACFTEILEDGNLSHMECAIAQRLSKNVQFFESFSPPMHTLLMRPPALYQLLLNEEGINIYQIHTKEFLFPVHNGFHTMIEASKQIATNPLQNPRWNITTNNLSLSYLDEVRFPNTGKIVGNMIDYAMQHEPMDTLSMHLPSRFLPTTTLFGLAGGLFLEYLLAEYDFIHTLLIFEEQYDFFRISCCFVDYEILFSKVSPHSCYLFVENIVDRSLVRRFYQEHQITSNFVRLELELYNTPKIQEIKSIVTAEHNANTRGWGTYEDEMVGVKNHQHNLNLTLNTLRIPVLCSPSKIHMPICIIGNGSSLDHLIPFIRNNQNNMILFSSGTALRRLIQEGIRPDFQIEIERLDYLPAILKEAGLGSIPVIGGNIVNTGVFDIAKEGYIFLRGSSAMSYANKAHCILEYTYPLVGNAATALAMQFSDTIVLCGLDSGYKKGHSKHAHGSIYEHNPKWRTSEYTLPKDAIPTRGNLGDDIYTDPLFTLSRQMYEYAIENYQPKTVYNLSDGAYIQGAIPTLPNTLTFMQTGKKAKIKVIKKSFSTEKKNVFSDCKPLLMNRLIESYIEDIFHILNRNISTKQEFFLLIDRATKHIQTIRRTQEHIGILMQGTMFHGLNTMFMLMVYTKTKDIASLHRNLVEIFHSGCKLILEHHTTAHVSAHISNSL
jgi:hypothetical protein